ncbi:MAG: iron-containing alcohol dehydrogenase [Elusimicrobiota bacterium]
MANNEIFKFQAKTEVIVSDDLIASVLKVAESERSTKVGVICDKALSRDKRMEGLAEALRAKYPIVLTMPEAIEPTTDRVDEVARIFRGKDVDLLVAVGGGSTLDLAKAVSVMAQTEDSVTKYHGTGEPLPPGITKIMVPSTAGTGSEVTPGAVLVNKETSFKRALGGPQVCPDYAILHAPLTLSMPDHVTASTGMDALAHAIESYTARCANRVTRMYSREAFALAYNNLPKALRDGGDLEARRNMLLGSCLAGFAIFNSNTGACHSMAYPLGIYHEVPHGVAVGLIIPKVVEINIKKGCTQYAELLDVIEGADRGGDAKTKAARFISLFKDFPALPLINGGLSKRGIQKKDVAFLAERGLDLTPALGNNPVEFTKENAVAVLEQLT